MVAYPGDRAEVARPDQETARVDDAGQVRCLAGARQKHQEGGQPAGVDPSRKAPNRRHPLREPEQRGCALGAGTADAVPAASVAKPSDGLEQVADEDGRGQEQGDRQASVVQIEIQGEVERRGVGQDQHECRPANQQHSEAWPPDDGNQQSQPGQRQDPAIVSRGR